MDFELTELIIWIVLCVVVGIIASNKGRSFFLYFLISVFLSPIIGGIIVLIVKNLKPKQVEIVSQPRVQEPEIRTPVDQAEALKKFKELLDDGVITQEEFEAKKSQILNS